MTDSFSVLIVCTANQCRSPMAEHILRDRIAESRPGWRISSAGIHATDGTMIKRPAAEILSERGISVRGWRSRRLDRMMINEADLILTATHDHRELIAAAAPSARSKTFTLIQFGQLVRQRGAGSERPASELLYTARAALDRDPQPARLENLTDPIGRPLREYRNCARVIDRAVASIVD